MIQLILHLVGDYCTQSDWMALNKRKDSVAAFAHAFTYSIPFLWLAQWAHNPSLSWFVILSTHFLIDRFGLARYLVWAKNFLAPFTRLRDFNELIDGVLSGLPLSQPPTAAEAEALIRNQKVPVRTNPPWSECSATGYPSARPPWLATWLLIAADNTLHLAINYFALKYL